MRTLHAMAYRHTFSRTSRSWMCYRLRSVGGAALVKLPALSYIKGGGKGGRVQTAHLRQRSIKKKVESCSTHPVCRLPNNYNYNNVNYKIIISYFMSQDNSFQGFKCIMTNSHIN